MIEPMLALMAFGSCAVATRVVATRHHRPCHLITACRVNLVVAFVAVAMLVAASVALHG